MSDNNVPPLSSKEAKRLGKWAKWFLIASILVLILNLPAIIRDKISPPAPYETAQRLKSSDKLVKRIQLAGQEMNIPVAYFFTPPSPGIQQQAALLIVMFPDFLPPSESARVLIKKGEWYKNIRILIDDQKNLLPWSALVTKELERNQAVYSAENIYGLKSYRQSNKDSSFKEVFIYGDPANPESYISCMPESRETYAQCSHYLKTDRFIITVDYDRKLLVNWKNIQEKTFELLKRFQISSSGKDHEL